MHCMVSDLLVFSERMGVSHSRRDCFIRSFFLLVGDGIAVGSYVKTQYLCCDLLLKGGSGLVLEIAGGFCHEK